MVGCKKGNDELMSEKIENEKKRLLTKKEAIAFLDFLTPKGEEYYENFLKTRDRLKEKHKYENNES